MRTGTKLALVALVLALACGAMWAKPDSIALDGLLAFVIGLA